MDVERIIDDIEQLQEMFEAPDVRPLSPSDISAANRRHDEMLAHSPWFQLWRRYGVCCRSEPRYSGYPNSNRRSPGRTSPRSFLSESRAPPLPSPPPRQRESRNSYAILAGR